jgi:hypothetical protein
MAWGSLILSTIVTRPGVASMLTMSAMPVEQVHKRTSEQQQVRQYSEEMRAMFGEQKKRGDRDESP